MFTLITKITIEKEHSDFVKSELKKLIEPSRAKEGCISYKMFEDRKHQNIVFFVETWQNNEVFSKHMSSDLIANYSKITHGKVNNLELNKIDEITI
ncbi:MAG: putative quinol monooxygenase [Flavobacteriales bacterium]